MANDLSRTSGSPPWERYEQEPVRAYAAFCCYRDLGATRSLDEVTRKLYPVRQEAKRALVGRIGEWSTRWSWVERARAWDDEMDRHNRESQMDMVREMNRRHVGEAKALQAKALEALKKLNAETMTAPEVLRFIVEAAKLERVAVGVPDEVQQVQHTGPGGGPVAVSVEAPPDLNAVAEILMVLSNAGVVPAGLAEQVLEEERADDGPRPALPPPG
jgi:hypothetical protein